MTSTNDGEANTEIQSGALNTIDAAADAFLALTADAEKPSDTSDETKKKKTEKPEAPEPEAETDDAAEEQDAEVEDESSDETEETEAEDDKPRAVADDEAVVKVKVGDEEHEVPVKDLKRLFGQEKALTQKSQEAAEVRKKLDNESARNVAALNVLLERAKAKSEPYKNIDFLVASKQLNTEELTALRAQAQAVFEEEKFLTTELDTFMKGVTEAQQTQLANTARETVKVLGNTESPYHIEGWNEKVYNDLRQFAVAEGLPQEIVNNLVEAPALKLIHMAMMFKKGAAKVVTQKVNKTAKKIVKTSSSPVAVTSGSKSSQVKKADANLRAKGTVDNATDAFLARMISDND